MMENFGVHYSDVLTYPLMQRCIEIGLLIDRCSIKELQDFFPNLIKSIFGLSPINGMGWGFRTITSQCNVQEFDVLYNFFAPMGPMFRLCYRLLNEPIKFDVSLDLLPTAIVQMLQRNQYSAFYEDMIYVDPACRQITSLLLNPFDYYILHFVLHGIVPLHKMYPSAMAVHCEKWKTIYFFLTADYLCTFLPSAPDTLVMPTNICSSKVITTMPIQTLKPTRSPKYLSISALSHNFSTNTTNIRSPAESTERTYSWRTESVLHFFIDIWLRYNVEENRDLPSSEFIRVVRILVKQLHSFGNTADLDNTSMAPFRKLAQPMMNEHIYKFLRNLISRWPLDSSFSVVLELWLSYIQPWRYTFEKHNLFMLQNNDMIILRKYETFITENIVSYTQIFIQLLLRFQRIDFSSFRNVLMLFRMIKVFGQSNLSAILSAHEEYILSSRNAIYSTPKRQSTNLQNLTNNQTQQQNFNLINDSYVHDDNYMYMFGSQTHGELLFLLKKLTFTKEIETERAVNLLREKRLKYKGFFKQFLMLFVVDEEEVQQEQALIDCKKIPEILQFIIHTISHIFQIELPDAESITNESSRYSWDENQIMNLNGQSTTNHSDHHHNEYSDNEICPSPIVMRKRMKQIKYTGDPALIPIRSNEFTFLVRFLHQVSCKLNLMYSNELDTYWHRKGLLGGIFRQLLWPPIVTKTFDKSHGISMLREEKLGPRINLRYLASYKTIFIIFLSCLFGKFFFGTISFGVIVLFVLFLLYIMIASFFNDPKIQ